MDRKNQTPQGQIAQVVVEFLEVAVSCIVFLKGFYPTRAFERRRYMNVVVQKAVDPQLAGYIHSVTTGLLPFIQKGLIERVVVIFYDKDHIPVEKFVFKLAVSQSYGSNIEQSSLEFALREEEEEEDRQELQMLQEDGRVQMMSQAKKGPGLFLSGSRPRPRDECVRACVRAAADQISTSRHSFLHSSHADAVALDSTILLGESARRKG